MAINGVRKYKARKEYFIHMNKVWSIPAGKLETLLNDLKASGNIPDLVSYEARALTTHPSEHPDAPRLSNLIR